MREVLAHAALASGNGSCEEARWQAVQALDALVRALDGRRERWELGGKERCGGTMMTYDSDQKGGVIDEKLEEEGDS